MCKCKSILICDQLNKKIAMFPPKEMVEYFKKNMHCSSDKTVIYIDECIADEVEELWNNGIWTTGCCCGHNFRYPYIGVIDSHIQKMKDLGYKVQFNYSDRDITREDTFFPKKYYVYD